jgi:hypothetical protein
VARSGVTVSCTGAISTGDARRQPRGPIAAMPACSREPSSGASRAGSTPAAAASSSIGAPVGEPDSASAAAAANAGRGSPGAAARQRASIHEDSAPLAPPTRTRSAGAVRPMVAIASAVASSSAGCQPLARPATTTSGRRGSTAAP